MKIEICDEEPGTQGPRRASWKEMEDAFADGWALESIEATRFEVRPDLKDLPSARVGQGRGSWW